MSQWGCTRVRVWEVGKSWGQDTSWLFLKLMHCKVPCSLLNYFNNDLIIHLCNNRLEHIDNRESFVGFQISSGSFVSVLFCFSIVILHWISMLWLDGGAFCDAPIDLVLGPSFGKEQSHVNPSVEDGPTPFSLKKTLNHSFPSISVACGLMTSVFFCVPAFLSVVLHNMLKWVSVVWNVHICTW